MMLFPQVPSHHQHTGELGVHFVVERLWDDSGLQLALRLQTSQSVVENCAVGMSWKLNKFTSVFFDILH